MQIQWARERLDLVRAKGLDGESTTFLGHKLNLVRPAAVVHKNDCAHVTGL